MEQPQETQDNSRVRIAIGSALGGWADTLAMRSRLYLLARLLGDLNAAVAGRPACEWRGGRQLVDGVGGMT